MERFLKYDGFGVFGFLKYDGKKLCYCLFHNLYSREIMDKLLPIRHPNRDFFIADLLGIPSKDDLGSMEHPIFSLNQKPDSRLFKYEHGNAKIEVSPSRYGRPTIWDKDVLIFCISQLVVGIERGRKPSRFITFQPSDLLMATNRNTGGKGYSLLLNGLQRLSGTRILSTVITGRKREMEEFSLLNGWKLKDQDKNARMGQITVELSEWLYRAIVSNEVLTIDADYFRLRKGVERRIYELARKHCGSQAKWCIGIELLHKKSGSQSPLKKFRHQLREISAGSHLPEYAIDVDGNKDQLIVTNKSSKRAMAARLSRLISQN